MEKSIIQANPNRTVRDALFDASCKTLGKDSTKFFFKIYDLIKFDMFGRPHGSISSFDITNKCNLRCKHCYFFAHDYNTKQELTNAQWIEKLDALKETSFPFYQCSWIGGEPLLRPDLIELGMKYFKSNLVATNGTIELPNWPDVNFYISVDGPKELHDEIRGAGMYEKTRKNADRPDLKIIVSMVISRLNYKGVERFLEDWYDSGIKACLFQIYTPVKGLKNDKMALDWELRDNILDKLIRLKDSKYGDFIGVPVSVLKLMKSDKCRSVTRNCLFRKVSFCLDPQGKRKKPCMLGPQANCERCGCVLPFHMKILENKALVFREIMMGVRKKIGGRALV